MPRGFFKIKKEEIMHKKFENKNVFAVIITVFACILTAFLIFISVKSKGQNEVTNQAIQGKVDSIIKLFNSQSVKMYFSSLVSNLRSVQIQALTALGTLVQLILHFN